MVRSTIWVGDDGGWVGFRLQVDMQVPRGHRATMRFDYQRREEPMNPKGNVVYSLVIAVSTAAVTAVVLGILDDHLAWIVALAIAIVPGYSLAGRPSTCTTTWPKSLIGWRGTYRTCT